VKSINHADRAPARKKLIFVMGGEDGAEVFKALMGKYFPWASEEGKEEFQSGVWLRSILGARVHSERAQRGA
jgi:hypothetical protein